MKHCRIQIGLRLMLLVVALFAVFFTWLGSQKELRRLGIKAELDNWEHARKYVSNAPLVPGMEAARKTHIEEIEKEIATRRELLGMRPAK